MKLYLIAPGVACIALTSLSFNTASIFRTNQAINPKLDSLCAIHYKANNTEYKKGIFILSNSARVSFKDTVIHAENIYINEAAKQLKAIKNVTLSVDNKIIEQDMDSLVINIPSCKPKL